MSLQRLVLFVLFLINTMLVSTTTHISSPKYPQPPKSPKLSIKSNASNPRYQSYKVSNDNKELTANSSSEAMLNKILSVFSQRELSSESDSSSEEQTIWETITGFDSTLGTMSMSMSMSKLAASPKEKLVRKQGEFRNKSDSTTSIQSIDKSQQISQIESWFIEIRIASSNIAKLRKIDRGINIGKYHCFEQFKSSKKGYPKKLSIILYDLY